MTALITPDQVPLWIPGKVTLDSRSQPWEGLTLKGYQYTKFDVNIPAMRDYMLVIFKGGRAALSKKSENGWRSERVAPGSVTILTREEEARWMWSQPIDVTHIYLSHDAVSCIAGELFDQCVERLTISSRIKVKDQVIPALAKALEQELNQSSIGGSLYVDGIKIQLAVHLLRHYTNISLRERSLKGGLMPVKRRQLLDYITTNLNSNISLSDLAASIGTSVSCLIRDFRAEFGCTPYAYVLQQRVSRAKKLLAADKSMPLKVVAAECGFSDQSHMTRVFRKALNVTPLQYRQRSGGFPRRGRCLSR